MKNMYTSINITYQFTTRNSWQLYIIILLADPVHFVARKEWQL